MTNRTSTYSPTAQSRATDRRRNQQQHRAELQELRDENEALRAEVADLKVQLFIQKYSLRDGRIEVPMIEREDDYIEMLAAASERIAHDPKIASKIRRRSEERLRGLTMWNQSEIAVQHNKKHREQSCACYKEATQ